MVVIKKLISSPKERIFHLFIPPQYMNIEFQYISIQLLIKGFFLILLLLMAFEFQKKSKHVASFVWLSAAAVFIHILISFPLPFQYEAIGFSYMSTHILGLMTINILRVLSIQFMPYEQPDRFVKSLKEPKVYMAIATIFILIVASIVVITGFGVFVNEEKIFYVFVSIDAVISTIVSLVWSYYFYCSFSSLTQHKGLRIFLAIYLFGFNLFYTLYFFKTLELLNWSDSDWHLILSVVLAVIQIVFTSVYLMGLYIQQHQDTSVGQMAVTDAELKEIISIDSLELVVGSKQSVLKLSWMFGDGTHEQEELVLHRQLKPFAYWFQFALAAQKEIWLTHAEISVIKFRMVEFWNKNKPTKITQELLFSDSRIQYALLLSPDQVKICFATQLKDRSIFESTFKEFYSDFLPWLKVNKPELGPKWTVESAFEAYLSDLKS